MILAALLLVGVAAWPALRKPEPDPRSWAAASTSFGIALLLLLMLGRRESLQDPAEINVDEGTHIALGMRYRDDPMPWRSADAITCGPLSTWIYLWAPLLNLPLTFFTLRLTCVILAAAAILAVALALKEGVGRRYALLVCVPAALFLAGTRHRDFVTAALEYLPLALAATAVWALASRLREASVWKPFVVGLLTGALPFTKLQSAPSAVFLFLAALAVILRLRRKDSGKPVAALVAGGSVAPVLILGPVLLAGAGPDFVDFYLRSGASYGPSEPPEATLSYLFRANPDFGLWVIASLLGGAALLAIDRKSPLGRERQAAWILLAGYTAVVLVSVLWPKYQFPHYLILLILPGMLLYGGCLNAALRTPPSDPVRRRIVGILLATAAVSGVPVFRSPAEPRPPAAAGDPVVPALLRHARPGDSMMIWGWVNRWHAATGLKPATRFVGAANLVSSSPRYARHRQVFLSDLKRERPRLFVDAVDEFRWFTWPPGVEARHDRFSELAEWIAREYALVETVPTMSGGLPVLIYSIKRP
jgi:hypothetical protein